MRTTKVLAILVFVLGLMVWSTPMVQGAQYLTVNGADVTSITLELGQSRTVEVVSTDGTSYVDFVGFDNGVVLGTFSHLETKPEAGNFAAVADYNQPAFYGYYISAAGISPAPSAGLHFVFNYVAQQVGEMDLKLYDSTFTSVIDSVHVKVTPIQPRPMGTVFSYQGRLMDSDKPADGLYDFEFKLYDNPDPVYAMQQGTTIDINDIDVIDGYFTVELDFGSDVFNGDARWLETTVMHADGSDPCKLRPRQEMTPVPYALQTRGIFTDNTGNVGIGTTSPQVKLHVDATGSVSAGDHELIAARSSFIAGPAYAGLSIGYRADGSNAVGGIIRSLNALPMMLGTTNSPGSMVILDSGNVGIGTNSPSEKLEVMGNAKVDQLQVKNNLLGYTYGGEINFNQNDLTIQAATDDDIIFKHAGGGETVRIRPGRVGIGTTNPQSHVQIDNSLNATGSGASNLALLLRRNSIAAGSGPGIGFCSDNSLAVGAKIVHIRTSSNSQGDLAFYTKSGTSGYSTEKMRIRDNGNVGIGTTVPIAKLQVEGDLRVTTDGDFLGSFLRTSGNLIANGEIYKQGASPVYINDDLDVNGKIYQRGTQIHADYVFEPDYKLESIEEHSDFMWQQKHLPAIPKAEVDEAGREIIEVGAHRRGIVEELEKAHIYIEQLHERIKMMEEKMVKLEAVVCTVQ